MLLPGFPKAMGGSSNLGFFLWIIEIKRKEKGAPKRAGLEIRLDKEMMELNGMMRRWKSGITTIGSDEGGPGSMYLWKPLGASIYCLQSTPS